MKHNNYCRQVIQIIPLHKFDRVKHPVKIRIYIRFFLQKLSKPNIEHGL